MTAAAEEIGAEIRRRASVLVEFEPAWLGMTLTGSEERDAFARFLAEDAAPGPGSGSALPRWRVSESVRVAAAAHGVAALRTSWRALGHRPDHPLQSMIDRLVGRGRPVELGRLKRSELEAVAQVSRWFDGAGAPIPPYADVDRRLRFELMMDPLRSVATEFFRDRQDERAQLSEQRQREVISIVGRGGIGKSALLAAHLLAESAAGTHVCSLSFDHRALDPNAPVGLVAEIARQLALQAAPASSRKLELLREEASHLALAGDSVSKVASRDLDLGGGRWSGLLSDIARLARGPVVVVFDTLEEAQRRDPSLGALRQVIRAASLLPDWRIIVSGRGNVDGFTTTLPLKGLPPDDAVRLLADLLGGRAGLESVGLKPADLAEIVRSTTTSPLCIRLAAGILKATKGDSGPLRDLDLQTGIVEGELYRRLLGYIEDPDVQKLAYPGLTLRRITPEIIREVLAHPLRVKIPTDDRARELFDALARESMLVDVLPDDVLLHRSDIRPLMLPRLQADNRQTVAAIHRSAIAYYVGRSDQVSHVQGLYHRLMREETPRTLNRYWHEDAESELYELWDELPPRAQEYLVRRRPEYAERLSADDLERVDESTRRVALEKQVRRCVSNGEVRGALDLLEKHRRRDGTSLVPLLELQVRELVGDLSTALELGLGELKRCAKAGDLPGYVVAALHCARLEQRLGDVDRAGAELEALAARIKDARPGVVDDVTRLRVVVARLRLLRFGSGEKDGRALVAEALALFDSIPSRTLRREPELLRDLAGELGSIGTAPDRVVTAALDAGELEDTDGTVAAALHDFDATVSQSRGLESGVVAEQMHGSVAEDLADAESSTAYEDTIARLLGPEVSSSLAADEVSKVIKKFGGAQFASLGDSITRSFRHIGDSATDLRIELE
jgi:hypothetical protein